MNKLGDGVIFTYYEMIASANKSIAMCMQNIDHAKKMISSNRGDKEKEKYWSNFISEEVDLIKHEQSEIKRYRTEITKLNKEHLHKHQTVLDSC